MKARQLGKPTFQRWREVLLRFDEIRDRIDPVMNENANLDVILRGMEADQVQCVQETGKMNTDARIRMQFQLSRVWLYGAYEGMRTLHQACPRTCSTPQHEKPCGEYTCLKCHISHVKNDLAVIRIPMAKGEVAGEVKNNPLPAQAMNELLSAPEFQPSEMPQNKFLLPNEGLVTNTGSVLWANYDHRLNRIRAFSRRDYSNRLLTFFDFLHDDPRSN